MWCSWLHADDRRRSCRIANMAVRPGRPPINAAEPPDPSRARRQALRLQNHFARTSIHQSRKGRPPHMYGSDNGILHMNKYDLDTNRIPPHRPQVRHCDGSKQGHHGVTGDTETRCSPGWKDTASQPGHFAGPAFPYTSCASIFPELGLAKHKPLRTCNVPDYHGTGKPAHPTYTTKPSGRQGLAQ